MSLCFRMMLWIVRAIWSEAPPAPAGTMISTLRVGSHAWAGAAPSAARRNNGSTVQDFPDNLRIAFFMCVSSSSCYGTAPAEQRYASLVVTARWPCLYCFRAIRYAVYAAFTAFCSKGELDCASEAIAA